MAYRLAEREDFEEKTERLERASRYTHFQLKNIGIPIAGLEPHCSDYGVFLLSYGNTRISAARQLWRLFEGGVY